MAEPAKSAAAEAAKATAADTPAAVAAKDEVKLARGTVAKGRTVFAPTSDRRVVTHTREGEPVYRFVEKAHGPGQEVTLPEEEILHLRRTGFLVDPNAEAAAVGIGPNFERQG